MQTDSRSAPPENTVFGPVSAPSSLRRDDPAASLTTPPVAGPPSISAAIAHLLAMSRAAFQPRLRVPGVSIDEATFVSSRRSCQE